MNIPEDQIEKILQQAPQLDPPPGLKHRLVANIRCPTPAKSSPLPMGRAQTLLYPGNWLRQWWPALGSALLSLGCGLMLAVQHVEIQQLKKTLHELRGTRQASTLAQGTQPEITSANSSSSTANVEQEEINRLEQQAAALKAEISRLEFLRGENAKLRAQLAAPMRGSLTLEEEQVMAQAQEKALSKVCVNNLKQLGLAVRIWGIDHGDQTPANVLQMTNEMNTPKILVCPGDTAHNAANDWDSFSAANCSYQYLAPSSSFDEPLRVAFRCPVHGHIGLCDGSVQMGVAKNHPEWLVQRDGKLYIEPPERQSVGARDEKK